MAGCSSASAGPSYDGGTSVGTATLSGANTGTVSVIVFGAGFSVSSDGGSDLGFEIVPPGDANPNFSCSGSLPGSSLVTGSFTVPIRPNGCRAYFATETSFQDWEVGTTFVFNITSPGAAYPDYGRPLYDNYWPYPSGSLTVTLATYPPYDAYSEVTVNLTFAPPPD